MTLKQYLPKDHNRIILITLLLVTFVLRCWNLTFQSYWLDELYTMNEADPNISWRELFDYLKNDSHPPLHYIISRFCFTVFGHTEFVGRFVSVVFGTAGVWAMWMLGKEIYGKRLGLTAAALTCINYFHIIYSQEARGYIMVFFFAALSFTYFIRILKYLKNKDTLLYAVFALLMMYTHYYGFFLAISQFITALIFIAFKRTYGKIMFIKFLWAGVVIIIGYLPWMPFLLDRIQNPPFWASKVKWDFLITFLPYYFGGRPVNFLFTSLFLFYLIEVVRSQKHLIPSPADKPYDPIWYSFIVFFTTAFFTCLIPYIWTVLVVPVILLRYTIVLVPAFLIVISFALVRIKNQIIMGTLLCAIIFFSLRHHFTGYYPYYSFITKTQFREITAYMASQENKTYPIINEKTHWHQQYYLKLFNYKGAVLPGKKENVVDSILKMYNGKYHLEGFWIAGFHGDRKLAINKKAELDTAYHLVDSREGLNSWAELYVSKKVARGLQVITPDHFPAPDISEEYGEKLIAVRNGKVSSKPVPLQKGRYTLTIISSGIPAGDLYPHLKIYLDQQLITEFYTGRWHRQYKATVTIPADGRYEISIAMDTDGAENAKSKNGKAFIKCIIFSGH